MNTRQSNGAQPVHRLRDEIESFFDGLMPGFGLLTGPTAAAGARLFPAVNVWEDADRLYAEAELPGLTMADIEVVVLGNELTLRGQRRTEGPRDVNFHRRERGVGSFQRVLRLPVEIDADAVEASLRNGVLTITMPKAPAARPRRIEVKNRSA